MDTGFYVWLYSTDLWVASDSASEVALSALPVAAQLVKETTWARLLVNGMKPTKKALTPKAQEQSYELETIPYNFPDEFDQVEAIYTALRNRYKFMSIDGLKADNSPETDNKYPESLHTANFCIALHHEIEYDTEHDFDNGMKSIVIKCKKRLPIL